MPCSLRRCQLLPIGVQFSLFESPQLTDERSASVKSALWITECEKFALARFAFLNEVPHLLVINEASLLIDSNPFAPLNAFLLMIAQLMARTVAPIPPPILEPNTLPVTLTRINKMKEDNEPANARARVPIAINTTTISRARHRNNIPLPVPNPEK